MEENRNQESIYNKTLEKGKEKERSKKDLEKNCFCNRLSTGTSNYLTHTDIYKHFPRWRNFGKELGKQPRESSISGEIASRENASYAYDQFIDDNALGPSPNTKKTGTNYRGKTVEKNM